MDTFCMKPVEKPKYSPDVSPNDFCFYCNVKNQLKGRVHRTQEELYKSVVEIISKIAKKLWISIFEKWITLLELLIYSNGNYL